MTAATSVGRSRRCLQWDNYIANTNDAPVASISKLPIVLTLTLMLLRDCCHGLDRVLAEKT